MENKKKNKITDIIFAVITIISFIAVTIGTTYAFYVVNVEGNDSNEPIDLKSADVYAMFQSTDSLNVEGMMPGYTGKLEFSIVNTSIDEDLFASYTLAWDITTNQLHSDSFDYTLEGVSPQDGVTIEEPQQNQIIKVTSPRKIPKVSTSIGSGIINTGVTHKYVLNVKFLESGEEQNDLQGKRFEGKIIAKGDPDA